MLRFYFADDFLRHAISHRIVYLGGNYGTGKSSLAVALSYLLLLHGRAKYCVSSMPVAWAIPASECPPNNFVALLDELGVDFDARSFADKKQNKVRRSIVAFMRKLNAYAIVSSKVTPDVSFRPLVVQRAFSIPFVNVDIFTYGLEEGKMESIGWFAVHNRQWLWVTDKYNPSPKYGNEYVPSEKQTDEMVGLFDRAIAEARKKADLPDANSFWALESSGQAFQKFYNLGYNAPAYPILQPDNGEYPEAISGARGVTTETGTAIHIGIVAEKSVSAGFGFNS